jgi:Zn-dependent protease with chaperone function
MERESLLTMLIFLLGGMMLQMVAAWPAAHSSEASARRVERAAWLGIWWPLTPTLVVAAWLCGWALSQPDPVPDRVGPFVFIACAPFAFLVIRAIIRAAWSLFRRPEEFGIATIGLVRPSIVFAPELAKLLDDRAIQAALEHERAHVRHRDPLRIWVAQFVTDLQWPWSRAQLRFVTWLGALEDARDDEARALGIEGSDLAAAVVASLRFHRDRTVGPCARLIGNRSALEQRIARLLQPLPAAPQERDLSAIPAGMRLIGALLLALALGVVYGERLIGPLLAFSS